MTLLAESGDVSRISDGEWRGLIQNGRAACPQAIDAIAYVDAIRTEREGT